MPEARASQGRAARIARALGLAAIAALVAAEHSAAADTSANPRTGGVSARAGTYAAHAPDLPGRSRPARSRRAGAAAAVDRSKLRRKLRKLTRDSGTSVWIYDRDARSERKLFSRRAGRSRILASNTKLFTTAAALQRLGGGERRLHTRAYGSGNVRSGTLHGKLYLVGDGDPALNSAAHAQSNGLPHTSLRALAKRIRRAGIRRIAGPIVADDSIFDRVRGVPDSNWQTSFYIGGPLSGLPYNSSRGGGDPAIDAAQALRKRLRKEGVRPKGKVRSGDAPMELLRDGPVAQVRSPRLAHLIEATNEPSNNFFAETLLKRLGARHGSAPGTTRKGTKVAERFAAKLGADARLADGSGLTRSNRSSARDVGRLLVRMSRHRDARSFYDSLPRAGLEGTLVGRMQGSAAQDRCRGKTGTISGVSALSGYCRSGHGLVAYSVLMNGVDVYSARATQDRIVKVLARYRPKSG